MKLNCCALCLNMHIGPLNEEMLRALLLLWDCCRYLNNFLLMKDVLFHLPSSHLLLIGTNTFMTQPA